MDNFQKLNQLIEISKDLTVLYVEDNLSMQVKTKSLLENFFNVVDVVEDGAKGLVTYQTKKYDIVITDLNMPQKDGIHFIKDIREINQEQVIIVISAYSDSHKLLELISLGISSFILKPISLERLINVIDSVVGKIHLKQIAENRMIEQSKLAQMGEMIDAIAHQWKQPISAISIMAQAMNYKLEFNDDIPKEELVETNNLIQKQTTHLIDTIDTFRKFFRQDQILEVVSLNDLVKLVKNIIKNPLTINDIEIVVEGDGTLEFECIKSEFIHIFINLICNAKDIFVEKNIQNRTIIFEGIVLENGQKMIQVSDNGGGVPDEQIKHIFEPHFTTKTTGSGVGLYMSKQIMHKINGDITVENRETRYGKGASFSLMLQY
ncbi:MAG: hybrid sensor histidine kinase/response regulator [Arcobacteraceae bacterium]|jgi:signal transduction histidine kinase|nr:hybrid sensor histidine kinase/response regulator [Arcobacteraceae bacterium]